MAHLTSWLFMLTLSSSLVSVLTKPDIAADGVVTVGPRAPVAQVVATSAATSIPTCEITGKYSLSWGDDDITSWIGTLPNATSSTSAAPTPAPSTAFSCTTNPNPTDPDYPCLCDGWEYCNNGMTCEALTSPPPAENCCLDCM